MRCCITLVVLALNLSSPPSVHADTEATSGTVSVDVVDPAKKGVAGVEIIVRAGRAQVEQVVTTGKEQPSDAELAAAARQGPKAIDALNSKFAAHATLSDLPLGELTIIVGAKGKPITIELSGEKPIWKVEVTVDRKSKNVLGKPRVVFDEVSSAKAQVARAQNEVAEARAAQAQAKAEQERARQEEERARVEEERARSDQERAREEKERADAARAKAEGDASRAKLAEAAERLKRQRAEAPSKVSASAGRCDCVPGNQIKVRCEIKNDAEVPVVVSLAIFAEGGTFGVDAKATATTPNIAARSTGQFDFNARLGTNLNCRSCKSQKCTITKVTVP